MRPAHYATRANSEYFGVGVQVRIPSSSYDMIPLDILDFNNLKYYFSRFTFASDDLTATRKGLDTYFSSDKEDVITPVYSNYDFVLDKWVGGDIGRQEIAIPTEPIEDFTIPKITTMVPSLVVDETVV